MRVKKDAKTNEQEKAMLRTIVKAYNTEDPDLKAWAIQEMIRKVRGFVGHMIDKHFPTYKKDYYDDLYSEGTIAVIEEMGHFDPEKGTLTTYFTPYILHRMNAFINNEVNRSTPYYVNIMRQIKKTQEYYNEIQVTPTVADIALHTGLSVKKVEDGLRRIEALNECHYQSTAELDAEITNNVFESPEEEIIKKEQNELLQEALSKLEELDQKIIMLKFGLDDKDEKSYAEIAKALGIPVNRVLNSLNRSIRIMRSDDGLKNLNGKRRHRSLDKVELAYMPDDTNFYDCLDEDFDHEIEFEVNVKVKKPENQRQKEEYIILSV